MGWLMDRVNPYWVIAGYFIVDAAAIVSIGYVPPASGDRVRLGAGGVELLPGRRADRDQQPDDAQLPARNALQRPWLGGRRRPVRRILFPALGGAALAAALPLETIMLATALPALVVAALIFALGIVNRGVIGGRMQRAEPA